MFETIMWATDGSAHSDDALPVVKELAAKHASRVIAAHVAETYTTHLAVGLPVHVDEDELKAKIEGQVQALSDAGIDAELMVVPARAPHSAHAIAEAAGEAGADLIVAGARGHTPLPGLTLGSVTHRLLQIAPCPVLTVPAASAGSGGGSLGSEPHAAAAPR